MDNLMDLIFGIVYNDHDSDLIGRDQVDDYTIDTCLTADQGYETAVWVADHNMVIVARYATMDNPYPQDDLGQTYAVKAQMGAMFDARCFNIPKEEVTNLVYWRQLDATRNSIQMVGQANFSHKELQGKSCEKIKEMLITEKEISWEDFHPMYKHGSCCIKVTTETDGVTRSSWEIDKNIPLFVGEGREYIESLIQCQEE